MDQGYERRTRGDRRAFAIFYRYGSERRNNTGNRRLDTVEKLQPYLPGRMHHLSGRDSEKAARIIKEIAEAFGVHPDTLEIFERREPANRAEIEQSSKDLARKNAELESELAESKKHLEQYRKQVEEILPSFSTPKGSKSAS
jgi:flagellar motility protein MotE (MotC chaperone)